jgi:hypothetical protein
LRFGAVSRRCVGEAAEESFMLFSIGEAFCVPLHAHYEVAVDAFDAFDNAFG